MGNRSQSIRIDSHRRIEVIISIRYNPRTDYRRTLILNRACVASLISFFLFRFHFHSLSVCLHFKNQKNRTHEIATAIAKLRFYICSHELSRSWITRTLRIELSRIECSRFFLWRITNHYLRPTTTGALAAGYLTPTPHRRRTAAASGCCCSCSPNDRTFAPGHLPLSWKSPSRTPASWIWFANYDISMTWCSQYKRLFTSDSALQLTG